MFLYLDLLALVFNRLLGRLSSGKKRPDLSRQLRDCRRFQERPQFKCHTERLFNARCRLGGQQRMASETEEVVVYANLLSTQDLCKNPAQGPFNSGLWRARRSFRN